MPHSAGALGDRPGAARQLLPLFILHIAYLAVAALYATQTPPWQAPDEPAHYNYVRQLAQGNLPLIEASDYDEQYRSEIVSSKFPPHLAIEPLSYEDWQPPLYYLLLTPFYLLFDGALIPLRLVSLLFGTGIIVAAYAVARILWPAQRWLALIAAAFVAFLPQHVAILASVNNDSLSLLIIALILWQLARMTRHNQVGEQINGRQWPGLGLLLGLGMVTKLTVYIMAPVILILALAIYRRQWRRLVAALLRVAAPAAILAAPLWLRNILVYPGFDPLAMAAHDAVVVGQPRTVEWFAQFGVLETLERLITTTFRSFWGQFGWMGVLMDARIYQLLLLFSMLVLLGLVMRPFMRRRAKLNGPARRNPLVIGLLWATFFLNILLYLGYNTTFVQHQGRYLFPALIPIAIAVAAAIETWSKPLTSRWPALRNAIPLLFASALFLLDLVALFRYIVPQLQ